MHRAFSTRYTRAHLAALIKDTEFAIICDSKPWLMPPRAVLIPLPELRYANQKPAYFQRAARRELERALREIFPRQGDNIRPWPGSQPPSPRFNSQDQEHAHFFKHHDRATQPCAS